MVRSIKCFLYDVKSCSSSVGLSIPSNRVGGCQFIFSFQCLLFSPFFLLLHEKLSLLLYILCQGECVGLKKLQNIFSNFWADCCETSYKTQILAYWNTREFTLGSFHLAMFILFFKDKCSFVLDEMCDMSIESEKWKFFYLVLLKGKCFAQHIVMFICFIKSFYSFFNRYNILCRELELQCHADISSCRSKFFFK